jgi:hypothetical protein
MTEANEERASVPSAEGKVEIKFSPDRRLNIAYNPNCTHENESRESIIRDVVEKSEAGGRSRCPRCDQQQMRFVPVKTALGLFAIGACDRCGYWYLM